MNSDIVGFSFESTINRLSESDGTSKIVPRPKQILRGPGLFVRGQGVFVRGQGLCVQGPTSLLEVQPFINRPDLSVRGPALLDVSSVTKSLRKSYPNDSQKLTPPMATLKSFHV